MLGQYTTIPNALFLDERLPRSCIVVFGVLQSHAGVDGKIYPSYDTIAQEGGISRRTAIYAVKRLEFYGYLSVEKGTFKSSNKQASNYYYLNPNPAVLTVKKDDSKNVDKSASYPQSSATDCTPLGVQNLHPKYQQDMKKNVGAYSNNKIIPIHAREKIPDKNIGEKARAPLHCENDNEIIGQCWTKKQRSPFNACAGDISGEKCLAKKSVILNS